MEILGDRILGVWDTEDAAEDAADADADEHHADQPVLGKQVLAQEPVSLIRQSPRWIIG